MVVHDWLHWLLWNHLSNFHKCMPTLSESLHLHSFVWETEGLLFWKFSNRIKTVRRCHLAWVVPNMTRSQLSNMLWTKLSKKLDIIISITVIIMSVSKTVAGQRHDTLLWFSCLNHTHTYTHATHTLHTASTRTVQTCTHSTINSLCLTLPLYSRVQRELLMPCVVLAFGEYQGSCRVMERA